MASFAFVFLSLGVPVLLTYSLPPLPLTIPVPRPSLMTPLPSLLHSSSVSPLLSYALSLSHIPNPEGVPLSAFFVFPHPSQTPSTPLSQLVPTQPPPLIRCFSHRHPTPDFLTRLYDPPGILRIVGGGKLLEAFEVSVAVPGGKGQIWQIVADSNGERGVISASREDRMLITDIEDEEGKWGSLPRDGIEWKVSAFVQIPHARLRTTDTHKWERERQKGHERERWAVEVWGDSLAIACGVGIHWKRERQDGIGTNGRQKTKDVDGGKRKKPAATELQYRASKEVFGIEESPLERNDEMSARDRLAIRIRELSKIGIGGGDDGDGDDDSGGSVAGKNLTPKVPEVALRRR
ncbi:hypothetical protein BU17DRAFT_68091 [Hysterangium stoloniferum]|nr:hypothetical protein BU17DRAFT_68091 [Hysterangium stoloniferum]